MDLGRIEREKNAYKALTDTTEKIKISFDVMEVGVLSSTTQQRVKALYT